MFGGPASIIFPHTDNQRWRCAGGRDCDAATVCDAPPGRYDVVGLLGVLGPGRYRLDVRAFERARVDGGVSVPSAP
jgi:hypothetical protein